MNQNDAISLESGGMNLTQEIKGANSMSDEAYTIDLRNYNS